MKVADGIALPTPAEIETIKPLIEDELKKAEVGEFKFGSHPNGGLTLVAAISREKYVGVQNALFAHGIVIVQLEGNTWGFAVRH